MLGTVLANRYSLIRIIGSGGMGDVYEARRISDGLRVAIKILREELVQEHEAVTRFHREVRAATALKSPYAARILDFGESPSRQPFMVMEFLEGRDLMDELEARGSLPVVEAATYLMQACEAMAEAHDLGIIHRDLKPPNLFLTTVHGRRIVKVLDFGISKMNRLLDGHITSTRMSFGSPLYMSPEQIRSTKQVDSRSDVWSLGVIFYELVTGEPPFLADTPNGLAVVISMDPHIPPSSRRPGLPRRVDEIVAGALQKDPAQRTDSVRALHAALSELVRDLRALGEDPTVAAGALPPRVPASDRRAITLGPATTDPDVRQNERLGKLAAAVLIPVGALAAGFSIWLFVHRTPSKIPSTPQTTVLTNTQSVSPPAVATTPSAVTMPTPSASTSSGAAAAATSAASASAAPVAKPTASSKKSSGGSKKTPSSKGPTKRR
jgi:eukaryotic-like serine/threonine-protein kinase